MYCAARRPGWPLRCNAEDLITQTAVQEGVRWRFYAQQREFKCRRCQGCEGLPGGDIARRQIRDGENRNVGHCDRCALALGHATGGRWLLIPCPVAGRGGRAHVRCSRARQARLGECQALAKDERHPGYGGDGLPSHPGQEHARDGSSHALKLQSVPPLTPYPGTAITVLP
jgi:hypothetical protein